jgi:hypothetical protein
MKKPAQTPPSTGLDTKPANAAFKDLLAPLKASKTTEAVPAAPVRAAPPPPASEKKLRKAAAALDDGDALFRMVMEEADRPEPRKAAPTATAKTAAPAIVKGLPESEIEALAQLAELVSGNETMRWQSEGAAIVGWDAGVDRSIAVRLSKGELPEKTRISITNEPSQSAEQVLQKLAEARRSKQRVIAFSWVPNGPVERTAVERVFSSKLVRVALAASFTVEGGLGVMRVLVRH